MKKREKGIERVDEEKGEGRRGRNKKDQKDETDKLKL